MSAVVQIQSERRSILATMAGRYSMEPDTFERTLRATVVPNNCSREQFAACLVVANEHRLNPLTKEIYFFPARGGGIVPIVGVDGWIRIINEHPAFDGMEFDTGWDDGKPFAVTCRMFRKDRSRPVAVTEFISECGRATDPWKQSPARMLRHKAMIQAARYAFGFSGIYDPDEAERFASEPGQAVEPPRPSSEAASLRSSEQPRTIAQPPRPAIEPPKPQPAAPEPEPVDYDAMIRGFDDMLSSCEAAEGIAEAIDQAGWIEDAPAEVRVEADKLIAAHQARIARQDEVQPTKPASQPPRPA